MDLVEDLKNILHTNKLVSFAYLFGSYARGDATSGSDVDIALFLEKTDLDTQLQVNYELSKFLKKDVDTLVLNSVKNLFLLESVFKEGMVLKDSPLRLDFELKKEHEILDYKYFKKMIDAA
jgi:hypothetical protein